MNSKNNKNSREKLQDFLINCFYSILSTEEKALEAFSNNELTLKEIHLIAAVFKTRTAGKNNFSTIARVLGITLGTLTTSFLRLNKKGYLNKVPHETDKRIFYIEPTEKAKAIHAEHVIFHEKMIAGVADSISEEQMEALTETLTRLDSFFRSLRAEYARAKKA